MTDEKKRSLSRRTFVAGTAAAGVLASPALNAFSAKAAGDAPDLAVASGTDAVKNTKAVIEAMGGIGKFVKPGQTVGLLPNAQGKHKGCSTHPDIVKTIVDLCKEAGAKEVLWYTWLNEKVQKNRGMQADVDKSGAKLVYCPSDNESLWKNFKIPRGVALKECRVFKPLWDCDVFINIPIVKDHKGSYFTGSLKNYMGASHPKENRTFHPTFEGDDVVHMEQCIADLNTIVRKSDLIIMDAMEILITNGPFGPGKVSTPQKVIAGVDRVAIDAYGATLLGLKGPEITMIKKSYEHGLGEIDLAKIKVKEITT